MLSPRECLALGWGHDALIETPQWGSLLPEVADAFERLRIRAGRAGFDLRIASGFRDYRRQWHIFNGKAQGLRKVHDDQGRCLSLSDMGSESWLHAILRYSALPGTSRHHWGTDIDIWDAAAVGDDYTLALNPAEFACGGPFARLSTWLSEHIQGDNAEGFYRPYAVDRGGVAPELWHLSYRPVAQGLASKISADVLLALWRGENPGVPGQVPGPLALIEEVSVDVEALLSRYVAP